MALVQLSLETLPQVKGGLVAAMLAKALTRMAVDIEQAPDIAEWRQVSLEIRAKPKCENGELDDVAFEFVVKGKVPSRVTSSRMVVRNSPQRERQFLFAIDSEDNPFQKTLADIGSDNDE